jgi:hypothetical protein
MYLDKIYRIIELYQYMNNFYNYFKPQQKFH